MLPTVTFENKQPVVFLPSGTKVSRHFKTKEDKFIRVKNLLSNGDSNTKLLKSNKANKNIVTYGLSLSPATTGNYKGNRFDNCPSASPACRAACLNGAGLASIFESIAVSRLCKTLVYRLANKWFINRLDQELHNKTKTANKNNQMVAVRPNVLSDLRFEDTGIIDNHPTIQFYDYTKHTDRVGAVRPNYWVTFSQSELNHWHASRFPKQGKNVAVVFAHPESRSLTKLPETYKGVEVINGDENDMRFEDKRGVYVGLELKTPTIKEYRRAVKSGFCVLTS